MRSKLIFISMLALFAFGCSANTATEPITPEVSESDTTATTVTKSPAASADSTDQQEIELSPSNTLIQFVGSHVGETPDPKARTGKFDEFSGKAVIADDELKSVSLEIQMASVQTGIDKLNNHLQAEDFFSVREYPTAKFETTKIARNEDGDHIITGNLTLHSKTNEVTFPASVGMVDGQLKLSGKMTLDRTEFGMDKNTEKVNANVEMTFKIGEAG